jgi:hypothetical protein
VFDNAVNDILVSGIFLVFERSWHDNPLPAADYFFFSRKLLGNFPYSVQAKVANIELNRTLRFLINAAFMQMRRRNIKMIKPLLIAIEFLNPGIIPVCITVK